MTLLAPVPPTGPGKVEAVEAVVIAAGFGSRLAELGPSKPLTKVCGMPLIAIVARQLATAGIRRIVVVTGHMAEMVEAALPAIADETGVQIEAVRVSDWSVPNGHSVMAGAGAVSGDYLLVMADHILPASILSDLKHRHSPNHAVTLAVDARIDGATIDPADATFVKVAANGTIRHIAKHLPSPDAVDCGAFLATPRLAEAIAEAIAAGRPGSLSDGMQRLADHGHAATMNIGDRWWIDVDDPASHRLAERDLFTHLPALRATPAGTSWSAHRREAIAPARAVGGA